MVSKTLLLFSLIIQTIYIIYAFMVTLIIISYGRQNTEFY